MALKKLFIFALTITNNTILPLAKIDKKKEETTERKVFMEKEINVIYISVILNIKTYKTAVVKIHY